MSNATRIRFGYVMLSGCLIPIGMAVHLSLPNRPGVATVAALWTAVLVVLVSLLKAAHTIAAPYSHASPADPQEPPSLRPQHDCVAQATCRTGTGGRRP